MRPGGDPGTMSSLFAFAPAIRKNDLHDKLRRGAPPAFTENHQNQRKLSNRTRRRLSSGTWPSKCSRALAKAHRMDSCHGAVRHPVRRPLCFFSAQKKQSKEETTPNGNRLHSFGRSPESCRLENHLNACCRIPHPRSPPIESVDCYRFSTSCLCHALLHPITLPTPAF